jgi:hypothetical protein
VLITIVSGDDHETVDLSDNGTIRGRQKRSDRDDGLVDVVEQAAVEHLDHAGLTATMW